MTLEEAREKIDVIDKDLRELFLKRMAVSAEIAEIKAKTGDEIYKPEREAMLIEKLTADVDEEMKPMYISFIKKILSLSREYQYKVMKDKDI